MRPRLKAVMLAALVLSLSAFLSAQEVDASALEAQYKTCSQHYIPADKCSPAVYEQLKQKTALDPQTTIALKAVHDYQTKLRIPDSLKVNQAYVAPNGAVCLDVAGQNPMGGMTTSKLVFYESKKGARWRGIGDNEFTDGIDPWTGFCVKRGSILHAPTLIDGLSDVTAKLNEALRNEK